MNNQIDHTKDAANKATDMASSAASMVGAYQQKLLEIAQANIQHAFKYGQALTAVRTPQDFMDLTTKFTRERMEMFQKHSQELAALMKPPSF